MPRTLWALAVLFMLCCTTVTQAVGAEKPNVIIIFADDLGYADIGYQRDRRGNTGDIEYVHTPYIDMICEEGIYLDDYVTHHVCSPSRAGLLTGKHPTEVWSGVGVGWHLQDSAYTIGHHFQDAGYETAVMGKWHNGEEPTGLANIPGLSPMEFGFDKWVGFHGGGQDNFARLAFTDPSGDKNLNWWEDRNRLGGEVEAPDPDDEIIDPVSGEPAYSPNILADKAVEFIEDNSDKPFMLYYPMPTIHTPYQVTRTDLKEMCDRMAAANPGFPLPWSVVRNFEGRDGNAIEDQENLRCHRNEEFDRRWLEGQYDEAADGNFGELIYYTMIYNMDKGVGAMMDAVDEIGATNNTIFVFTSDNGAVTSGDNGELRGHKKESFEGGIKVPAAIWYPNTLDRDEVSYDGVYDDMVQYVDLFPTLAGLAGLDPVTTPGLDGKDLSGNLFSGLDGRDLTEGDDLYYGLDDRWANVRNNRYKLHYNQVPSGANSVNWLYDLQADPNETTNLMAGSPSAAQRAAHEFLVGELEAWFDSGITTASYMRPPTAIRESVNKPAPAGEVLRLRATLDSNLSDPSSQGIYRVFGVSPYPGPTRSSFLAADHLISFDVFIPPGSENQGIVVTPGFNDVDNTRISPLHNYDRGIDLDSQVLARVQIPTGTWRRCVVPIGDAAPYRSFDFMIGILGPDSGDYEVLIDNVTILDGDGNIVLNVWADSDDDFRRSSEVWQESRFYGDEGDSRIENFSDISLNTGYNISNTPPNIALTYTTTDGSNYSFNSAGTTDSDGISAREWDFGDGSMSTAANPSHNYATAGSYLVTLTVTDGEGLKSEARVTVNVGGPGANVPPTADILANPLTGPAPLEVEFDGTGSTDDEGVVSFQWDFDDGSGSTTNDPTHTFTTPGTYNVSLTVEDEEGASDTASVEITVTAPVEPQGPFGGTAWPIPGTIQAEDYDVGGPEVSYFDNDVGNFPGEYRSDDVDIRLMDDGVTYALQRINTPEWLEYTVDIAAAGTYDFTMRYSSITQSPAYRVLLDGSEIIARNSAPATGTINTFGNDTVTGVVLPAGEHVLRLEIDGPGWLADRMTFVAAGVTPNLPPTADISATPETGTAPLDVTFDSSGSSDDVGIVSYEWDFDDGSTSTLENPEHTFTTAGTYTVSLTVTDGEGETDVATIDILVTDPAFPQGPYEGTAWSVPGTIQAEDYDVGGEGVSYSDSTAGNGTGAYRSDDVDIRLMEDGVTHALTRVVNGEWLEYTVDVASAGLYDFSLRYSSVGSSPSYRVLVDGSEIIADREVAPATGSINTWGADTVNEISLDAGEHIVRIEITGNGWLFDEFSFVPSAVGPDLRMVTLVVTPAPVGLFVHSPSATAPHVAGTGATFSDLPIDIDQLFEFTFSGIR